MANLPPVHLRWRRTRGVPKTGPGSLCAECGEPFTAAQWDRRHTTGAPSAHRFTHEACCWCASEDDQ